VAPSPRRMRPLTAPSADSKRARRRGRRHGRTPRYLHAPNSIKFSHWRPRPPLPQLKPATAPVTGGSLQLPSNGIWCQLRHAAGSRRHLPQITALRRSILDHFAHIIARASSHHQRLWTHHLPRISAPRLLAAASPWGWRRELSVVLLLSRRDTRHAAGGQLRGGRRDGAATCCCCCCCCCCYCCCCGLCCVPRAYCGQTRDLAWFLGCCSSR
jgi:hypothetical protein